MRLIEESNPDYESCADCIHSDDSEEICVLRRCIHAVSRLKECYVPKSSTIERTGKWIDYSEDGYVECPFCHSATNCDDNIDELHFCFSCGAKMEEPEDIPMEYFESGGR